MGVYSISDLSGLTGIKAHTLRVWEKRYGLLRPRRTEGNVRYYEDEDLRHLLMVVALYQKGLRISRIAELGPAQIEAEYRQINRWGDHAADRLRQALVDLDVHTMDELLDQAIRQDGFESVLFRLLLPLLDQMEAMWLSGAVEDAHEALLREQIRRKTIREIDALPRQSGGSRIVMFLPQGNQQELSHLFMHYFLRQQGISVTDLGCDVQVECALSAVRRCAAEAILLVNADPVHWQFGKFIEQLRQHTDLPILISGRASEGEWPRLGGQVIALDGFEDTIRFVRDLEENLARMNG